MTNHFYSINRGKSGLTPSDITRATSSTSGDDIELRLADGASLTRKDVILALEAFEKLWHDPGSAPGGTNFPAL
jgi:hypothetical protein